ncbi:hypothetical protein TNCV_1098131 [Trichonephila clavipes]|nr:hypothetical protein TNCV_1098131 [Trichonephila clavipes]
MWGSRECASYTYPTTACMNKAEQQSLYTRFAWPVSKHSEHVTAPPDILNMSDLQLCQLFMRSVYCRVYHGKISEEVNFINAVSWPVHNHILLTRWPFTELAACAGYRFFPGEFFARCTMADDRLNLASSGEYNANARSQLRCATTH